MSAISSHHLLACIGRGQIGQVWELRGFPYLLPSYRMLGAPKSSFISSHLSLLLVQASRTFVKRQETSVGFGMNRVFIFDFILSHVPKVTPVILSSYVPLSRQNYC